MSQPGKIRFDFKTREVECCNYRRLLRKFSDQRLPNDQRVFQLLCGCLAIKLAGHRYPATFLQPNSRRFWKGLSAAWPDAGFWCDFTTLRAMVYASVDVQVIRFDDDKKTCVKTMEDQLLRVILSFYPPLLRRVRQAGLGDEVAITRLRNIFEYCGRSLAAPLPPALVCNR